MPCIAKKQQKTKTKQKKTQNKNKNIQYFIAIRNESKIKKEMYLILEWGYLRDILESSFLLYIFSFFSLLGLNTGSI